MRIEKIDDTLERCEKHLSSVAVVDESIENLLTQSILILICAEFESKLKGLIVERCSGVPDGSIKEYIGSCTNTVLRSLRLSDMAGFLSRFGTDHRADFRRRLAANERARSMYDSVWTNRNSVAHGEGSSATFGDVKRYYEEGHVVLDYFREALWLPAPVPGGTPA
jgi:hypothetical protein